MHQTKKGNQWYFGMKAHSGVDSQTKVIHAVVATPATVHDSVCLPDPLHDSSSTVLAEAQGQTSWKSMVGLWKSQKRSATSMA
jgi:IS5 family transposase